MPKRAGFPFPYFGHAYSEDQFIRVCVWLTEPPSEEAQERITGELGELHVFFDTGSGRLNVKWSGSVISYGTLVDRERKYVEKSNPRVKEALKRADLKLYNVRPHAMRAVPFTMHLLVDQALARLHARFPIAFAVRSQFTRDKPTEWHDWSLSRCADTFARIRAHIENGPPSVVRPKDDRPCIAPWLRATTMLARACTSKTSLSNLDGSAKSALGDLLTLAAARATPPDSSDATAAARELAEDRDALLGLAGKLTAPRDVRAASPAELLDRIEKEMRQFHFTTIKLTECPTFVAIRKDPVRFPVCVLATDLQLRAVESEGNSRDVRRRMIGQLLGGAGTFGRADALAMLATLLTGKTWLNDSLPIEAIASKLEEHVATEGPTTDLGDALEKLLGAEGLLVHPTHRAPFERVLHLIRPEIAAAESGVPEEPVAVGAATRAANEETSTASGETVACSDVDQLLRAARSGAAFVTLRPGRYQLDVALLLRYPMKLHAEPEAVLVLARPDGRIVASATEVELVGGRFEVRGAETGAHTALTVTAGSATIRGCELIVERDDWSADGESIGVLAHGTAAVRIEKTRLSAFANGVVAQNEAKIEAADCDFAQHAIAAVRASDEADVVLIDSRVVQCESRGVLFEGAATGRLLRTVCTGGIGVGVEIRSKGTCLVRDCVLSGFGQAGVLLDTADAVLQNNVVVGCHDGIVLQQGGVCELRGNVLWQNAHHGVLVRDVFLGCKLHAMGDRAAMNGRSGFTIEHPGGQRLTRCSSYLNAKHGLEVDQSHAPSRWSRSLGTVLQSQESRLFANERHGLSITGYAEVRAQGDRCSCNAGAGVHVTGSGLAKLDDCYLEDNGTVGLLIEESAGGQVRGSRIGGNRSGGIAARGTNSPILEGSAVTGNGGPAVSLPEALRPGEGGKPKFIAGVPAKSIHYASPSDGLPTSDFTPATRPRFAERLVCMVSGMECRGLVRIFLTARRKAGDPMVYFAAPLLGYFVDGAPVFIERTANAELCATLFPERKRSEARSRLELGIEELAREPMTVRGYRCEARFVDEGVYLAMLAIASASSEDAWAERQALEAAPLASLLAGSHELSKELYGGADAAQSRGLRPDLADLSLFSRAIEGDGFEGRKSHPAVRALLST